MLGVGRLVPQWPSQRMSQLTPYGEEEKEEGWLGKAGREVMGRLVTLLGSLGAEVRRLGWVKGCAARANVWSCDLRRMSQSASSSRIRALERFWSTMVLRTFMCARHEPLFPRRMDFSQSSPGTTLSGTSVPRTPLAHVMRRLVRAAARVMASRRSVRSGRLMTKSFWNWKRVNVSRVSG